MSFDHELAVGRVITNAELTQLFKCSGQGGMRRSHATKTLVLTSDVSGGLYHDRWDGKVFLYTGMGQIGDQSLTFFQNRTLAESNRNGVAVQLFDKIRDNQYRYRGQVKLVAGPFQETQPDADGQDRLVWVFPLAFADTIEKTGR